MHANTSMSKQKEIFEKMLLGQSKEDYLAECKELARLEKERDSNEEARYLELKNRQKIREDVFLMELFKRIEE